MKLPSRYQVPLCVCEKQFFKEYLSGLGFSNMCECSIKFSNVLLKDINCYRSSHLLSLKMEQPEASHTFYSVVSGLPTIYVCQSQST